MQSSQAPASASTCPVSPEARAEFSKQAAAVTAANATKSSGKCPVDHGGANNNKKADASRCPVDHAHASFSPANSELPPNQKPAPGQRHALPTDRVVSSIPSAAGGDPLWVYPSQQMFYNAMKRKGYAPQEEEMNAVVAIHNAVNERTWAEVVAWEATLHPECTATLKLARFQGKPTEPTPKARLNSLMGYSPPFDRHDWVVTRCGEEVTYLIDFYHGRKTAGRPVAMHIDARPAGNDFAEMWDRVQLPFVRFWKGLRG